MAAIDLYSGIGGWTLGFGMAGIPVIASYEWWKDANLTHKKNFGSQHAETNIRKLKLKDLPDPKGIDFVVGSPPCTQFSYSNRGGSGDIKDGLIDIRKFLEVVEYMQPTYWAMENVPRVAKILEKEIRSNGRLRKFKHLFGEIRVYNSADFGVPQDRKRMIAGRLPFNLLDAYAKNTKKVNMSEVLNSLLQPPYTDPLYGLQLQAGELSDHVPEPRLSPEEVRINGDSKTHHPVYNKMSFPDRQDRPSRTITALCTRVSRESIIIQDEHNDLRRLTIRERAGIQSFPINYQFFGGSYTNKLKMIGNAVPPLLTFYIAQSMQETPVENLLSPRDVPRARLVLSPERAMDHVPDNEGTSYSWNRSFWLAIQGLRFGSGVRFELRNHSDKESKKTDWGINFFYGTSKNIKKKELDRNMLNKVLTIPGLEKDNDFPRLFEDLQALIKTVKKQDLQDNWTNKDREKMSPIYLIDQLTGLATSFKTLFREKDLAFQGEIDNFITKEFDDGKNKTELKKLTKYGTNIVVGIVIGACFNTMIQGGTIQLQQMGKQKARA